MVRRRKYVHFLKETHTKNVGRLTFPPYILSFDYCCCFLQPFAGLNLGQKASRRLRKDGVESFRQEENVNDKTSCCMESNVSTAFSISLREGLEPPKETPSIPHFLDQCTARRGKVRYYHIQICKKGAGKP